MVGVREDNHTVGWNGEVPGKLAALFVGVQHLVLPPQITRAGTVRRRSAPAQRSRLPNE